MGKELSSESILSRLELRSLTTLQVMNSAHENRVEP
jgi:hypothetical protein